MMPPPPRFWQLLLTPSLHDVFHRVLHQGLAPGLDVGDGLGGGVLLLYDTVHVMACNKRPGTLLFFSGLWAYCCVFFNKLLLLLLQLLPLLFYTESETCLDPG